MMAKYVIDFIIFMMCIPLLLSVSNDYYNLNEKEDEQYEIVEEGRRSDQIILKTENVAQNNMLIHHAKPPMEPDEDWFLKKTKISLLQYENFNESNILNLTNNRSQSAIPAEVSIEEMKLIEKDINEYFYEEIPMLGIDNSFNESLQKIEFQKYTVGQQLHRGCNIKTLPPRLIKWYVSEQNPCWNLPVLYGQSQNLTENNEVFALHGKRLKKIVLERNDTSILKQIPRPKSYYRRNSNEWCNDLPCYADHTLCYFNEKNNSKFCQPGYVIQVPGVFEQITIVNTINSMRNHIANGRSTRYSHLPTAANMEQIVYHYDLQKISKVWLRQCLPGPAMCSSLNGMLVSELECTKHADLCCLEPADTVRSCSPLRECFTSPIIGCLYAWFDSAGKRLKRNHIACGHILHYTYHTVQLLWAKTSLIGCAMGKKSNGDIRVICNFSPGVPFSLRTNYFCGVQPNGDITESFNITNDITSLSYAKGLGISLMERIPDDLGKNEKIKSAFYSEDHFIPDSIGRKRTVPWGSESLYNVYSPGWARHFMNNSHLNGTIGFTAKLVTEYTFYLQSFEPIYIEGPPGSKCSETGWLFSGLCYEYRDPNPSYRLVAVLAPVALFTLILYDLFSGVVRQTIQS